MAGTDQPQVSIDATEFKRRVIAGEPVRGCMITEPVVIWSEPDAPTLIKTSDWRHCVFQHNVMLHNVIFDPQFSDMGIDARGCSFQQNVRIEHIAAAPVDYAGRIALILSKVRIDGDFTVALHGGSPVNCSLEFAHVGGHVHITGGETGKLAQLDATYATIGGNLLIVSRPAHVVGINLRNVSVNGSLQGLATFSHFSAPYSTFKSVIDFTFVTPDEGPLSSHVFFDFAESTVGASIKLASIGDQPLTYHFSNSRIAGKLSVGGVIKSLTGDRAADFNNAHIAGDLAISVGGSETPPSERGRRFEMTFAKVGGSVYFIAAPSAGSSDVQIVNQHCLEVSGWGIEVAGDFRIRTDEMVGSETEAANIQLRYLSLTGAIIARDVNLRHLTLTSCIGWASGWATLDFRNTRAAKIAIADCDVSLSSPTKSLWVNGEDNCATFQPDAQLIESWSVIDFSDAIIEADVNLREIRGSVGPFDGVVVRKPLLVQAESIQCKRLRLEGLQVSDCGDGLDSLLPISGRGADISGELEIWPVNRQDRPRGARWTAQQLSQVPSMDFTHAQIGSLQLTDPPPVGKLDLRGAQVVRWNSEGESTTEIESAATYLQLLKCMSQPDSSIYTSIESRLAEIGKRGDADQIHIQRRRNEQRRDLASGHRTRWFAQWLHGATLGYGTRPFLKPVLALLVVFAVALGLAYSYYGQWFQLSTESLGQMQECGQPCAERLAKTQLRFAAAQRGEAGTAGKRLRDSTGFVTRNLVPMVDLQVGKGLEPVGQSGGAALSFVLKLMGWILWPILLSSFLVTILHSRHR